MDDGDTGGGEGGDEPSIADLQAQLAEATKNITGLKSKNDELLGEKKKETNKRREAEELARKETEEKARADGDHEQLYKSSEAERAKLRSELDNMINANGNEKRKNAAMKIATELADGYNAELLSESIEKRLKWSEGSVKVTDDNGELTVSSLDELKTQIKNNERFASLLKGNQSSGGGASGGSNSGGAAKSKTRAEFDALNPVQRQTFFKDGGVLI